MGVTCGAGTAYSFGAPEFTPGVTRSLVLCLVDGCLSFSPFSFVNCAVL